MKKGLDVKLVLNLERFRRARNVSLEQISEATKISTRFLQAIEAEQFEKLPGGIFDTSYLRQYAAAIGLEPAPLLACYRSKMRLNESLAAVTVKPNRWSLNW